MKEVNGWRDQVHEWGESLMDAIWGPAPQERATPITRLQGWIEESPV